MWSAVQYRRIRKDVDRDWRKEATLRQTGTSHHRTAHVHDPESGSTPGSYGVLNSSRNNNTCIDDKDDTSSDESNKDGRIIVDCPPDDPIDPRNWPLLHRAETIAILFLLVFVQGWAGAADSMANSKASEQFHVGTTSENLATAMFLYGIGTGCFFAGPLSQSFGRNPVILMSTFVYLFFVLGTALSDTFGGHIVCRYLVGLSASGTLGINGAIVNDLFRPVERALWFPLVAWVNVVPPTLAPIVGGWVASRPNLDWRWMEWITLIISAFAFTIAFLFMPETYLPVLTDWKAEQIRRVTGDERYISAHAKEVSFVGRLKAIVHLPIKFATSEPAILALGGLLVLLYILVFTFLSGFEYIFKKTYDLNPLQQGACFASIALGATLFTITAPGFYRWSRHRTDYVDGAPIIPEFRLWPALITAPLLSTSLFWLGWTNYASISIWSGLAACFCFGLVLNAMYVSCSLYIIDSYGEHAAVALSTITMMRYFIAGGMVMAARPMYEGIGVHWTMTLLGCVAVVFTPGPYLLKRYGRKLRERSPYATSDVTKSSSDH